MSEVRGRIHLCQPTYGAGTADSHASFWRGALRHDSPWQGRINKAFTGRSLLANTFNILWCHALNLQLAAQPDRWKIEEVPTVQELGDSRIWKIVNKDLGVNTVETYTTREDAESLIPQLAADRDIAYFAMLHDDVAPADGWLDQLISDLEESGADMVAAVIPIKDQYGLTSTAIDDPSDPFHVERRITMTELMRLPEVFTAADCGYPDNMLLANTGCWVCKWDSLDLCGLPPLSSFKQPRAWQHHVRFTIDDEIRFNEKTGQFQAEVSPEDWDFSRQVQRLGLKVACTRRVKLVHDAHIQYANERAWGEWKHDKAYEHKFGGFGILEPKPSREEEIAAEIAIFESIKNCTVNCVK